MTRKLYVWKRTEEFDRRVRNAISVNTGKFRVSKRKVNRHNGGVSFDEAKL